MKSSNFFLVKSCEIHYNVCCCCSNPLWNLQNPPWHVGHAHASHDGSLGGITCHGVHHGRMEKNDPKWRHQENSGGFHQCLITVITPWASNSSEVCFSKSLLLQEASESLVNSDEMPLSWTKYLMECTITPAHAVQHRAVAGCKDHITRNAWVVFGLAHSR